MYKKKIVSSILLLCFSGVLLNYVFRDFKFSDFIQQTYQVNWEMIIFAGLSMLLSAWFRSLRWLMFFSPLGFKVKKAQAFSALMLSYPANLIIPQSSFFVRASYIKKMCGVPFVKCLGTIVAEKLMDGVVVFGLFFLLLWSNFSLGGSVNYFNTYLAVILLVVLSIIILFYLLLETYFQPTMISLTKNIADQYSKFKIGLISIQNVSNKNLFFLYTVLIWIPHFAVFYFLVKSAVLKSDIGLKLPLELSVMADIGWISPTQAGIGPFHFFVSKIMQLHGFDTFQSAFFAFFSHTMITFGDVSFGAIVALANVKAFGPYWRPRNLFSTNP